MNKIPQSLQLLIVIIFLSSCVTSDKKENAVLLPKGVEVESPELILENAYSGQIFDNQLVFLRKLKSHHNEPQVYVKFMKEDKLKRVTFSRSENFTPNFYKKNFLIYVSGIDELKEFPKELYVNKNKFEWPFSKYESLVYTEIYLKNFNTYYEKRLSYHGGSDFHPTVNKYHKELVYVSQKTDGSFSLRRYFFKKHKSFEIMQSNNMMLFPNNQNSKFLVWVEYDVQQNTSYVYQLDLKKGNKQKKTELIKLKGLIHSLHWVKDQDYFLFSSNINISKNFEIYLYNLKEACLIRQTYSNSDKLWPFYYNESQKGSSMKEGKDKVLFSEYVFKEKDQAQTSLKALNLNLTLPCQKIEDSYKMINNES